MLKIGRCRADHLAQPMGVDHMPEFGWVIEGDGKDVLQTWYQLQLAEEASFDAPLYDSGKVFSDQSAYARIEGVRLKSAHRYYWRVRAGLNTGEETDYSAPNPFFTALLSPSEWKARFVSPERASEKDESSGRYLRHTFHVGGPVRSAFAYTTALGVYHFFLNGKKVGKDQLAPGWTSYHKQLMVQSYDVTEWISEGENCVGAMLGAGWYKGLMGFLKERNNYGERTAFLCQIEIEQTDGRRLTVTTGDGWLGAPSPVVFSEIYDGEVYDARMEIDRWCKPGFSATGWRPAETIDHPMTSLRFQPGARPAIAQELPAERVFMTPEGDTVIDFGQNLTGFIRFAVNGSAGDVVELHCFEVLDANGNVYTANLRKAKQLLRYTLKGGETEVYQPLHTFQGFRYAHVKKWPGAPVAEMFIACVVHTDMPSAGSFHCSNPLVNRLHQNILWGLKGNFLDVPTDCPQRDERMGWTGDAQIFCRTACYLMDVYPFFQKWLRDLAADQTPEGGVPHVVPDIVTGRASVSKNWLLSQGTHSAAAWGDAAVIIPWTLYLCYGDARILAEQYDSMKAWIDFMHAHADGVIWNYKLQFGDWVALDAAEGSYWGATPNELSCTAYYAYSTGLFSKAAGALGRREDAEKYRALYEEIVKGFQARFFDEEGNMVSRTQTSHILALYFDLVPPAFRQKTVDALIALLKEHGGLVTGFMGTPYFTHALSRNNELEAAYALLLKEDFPSWLYQVKMGATTIWEHWDGIKPNGSMWSPEMNSFNHYAYGAIGEWLYRVVAGIEPDEANPGYRHVLIRPRVGGGLTSAGARYEGVYGEICVEWKVCGDEVALQVWVPHNSTAQIELPDARALIDAGGLTFDEASSGYAASAGSGRYIVRYSL